MPKQFLLIFFCLAAAASVFSQTPTIGPGVSHDLAIWRAEHYSDVRYKLNLTLEKMSPVLKGTIEIRVHVGTRTPLSATPATAGELPPIILDWRKLAGHEKDSTITNVTVNGAARSPRFSGQPPKGGTPNGYEERSEHLIFTDGVRPGENVIKLDFTSPILTSGSAITRYVDKEDGAEYIYSLFVPSDASTAFPVFDQPDLKARFELILQTPASWNAISNTDIKMTVLEHVTYIPVERLNRGFIPMRSFLFDETKPISTYVFAFAAGPWQQVSVPGAVATGSNAAKNPVAIAPGSDRTPISIFVRKSQAAKFQPHAAEVFRLTREGIKYLETYFDYKFPFPKYDIVLISEFPFGGMEHAGATFLRETSVIFPQEPTKNDYISRATLIFHETAHQWFGDTVTMKWFDDLWLKEGFANFMAYKTLEKVMPEANAWKVFYERIKQPAYATDSTKGTTPIYQEIKNLSAAKSAYGNIVYNKAPAFLRQAEFYLGEDKFQTAVRAFLKKHEYANAGWEDLVTEFEEVKVAEVKAGDYYQKLSGRDQVELERFIRWSVEHEWAEIWVQKPGTAIYRISPQVYQDDNPTFQMTNSPHGAHTEMNETFFQESTLKGGNYNWLQDVKIIEVFKDGNRREEVRRIGDRTYAALPDRESEVIERIRKRRESVSQMTTEEADEGLKSWQQYILKRKNESNIVAILPNYQDYGYGIFLLDDKSRDYVLKNIQNEKDDFLRTMMWGALWDSVREGELDPREYVELVVKTLSSPPCLGGVPEGRGGSAVKGSLVSPCGQGSVSRTTTPSADQPALDKEGSLKRSTTPSAETAATPPNPGGQQDESTIQMLLSRVSVAMNYYLLEPPALAGGQKRAPMNWSAANAAGSDMPTRLEALLIERMQNAPTLGQRITYYRAFLNIASTEKARGVLKQMLVSVQPAASTSGTSTTPSAETAATPPKQVGELRGSPHKAGEESRVSTTPSAETAATPPIQEGSLSVPLRTKDRFDIVTRLIILGDPDGLKLLADLEKSETGDDAKRYAFAARAGIPTAENKAKYWNDFVNNKEISESWIEAAFGPWNSIRQSDLTLPYLERALKELPNHKRNRKIFFVNGWLGAFIGGQRSEEALAIVNKFLADNPSLDNDLRLKILENVDLIERAVRIRGKYGKI